MHHFCIYLVHYGNDINQVCRLFGIPLSYTGVDFSRKARLFHMQLYYYFFNDRKELKVKSYMNTRNKNVRSYTAMLTGFQVWVTVPLTSRNPSGKQKQASFRFASSNVHFLLSLNNTVECRYHSNCHLNCVRSSPQADRPTGRYHEIYLSTK